ncbi:MAG: rRNA maturation RNase YbeY [Candidatus Margulisiibacteriota bacterium]
MRNSIDPEAPIFINNEQIEISNHPFELQPFVARVIQYLSLSIDYIEITLLDSKRIQELNQQYFKNDVPTDTISFNLTPESDITGDIYLCPLIIQKNASEFDTTYEKELKTVIIHSILHLTGLNDESPEEYRKMQEAQARILKALDS